MSAQAKSIFLFGSLVSAMLLIFRITTDDNDVVGAIFLAAAFINMTLTAAAFMGIDRLDQNAKEAELSRTAQADNNHSS